MLALAWRHGLSGIQIPIALWAVAGVACATWLAYHSGSDRLHLAWPRRAAWTILGFFAGPVAVGLYWYAYNGALWERTAVVPALVPVGAGVPAYRMRAVYRTDYQAQTAIRGVSALAHDVTVRWADPESVHELETTAARGVYALRIGWLAWIGLVAGAGIGAALGGVLPAGILASAGWLAGALAQPRPAGQVVEVIVPSSAGHEVEERLIGAGAAAVLPAEEADMGEVRYGAE